MEIELLHTCSMCNVYVQFSACALICVQIDQWNRSVFCFPFYSHCYVVNYNRLHYSVLFLIHLYSVFRSTIHLIAVAKAFVVKPTVKVYNINIKFEHNHLLLFKNKIETKNLNFIHKSQFKKSFNFSKNIIKSLQ